MNAQRLPASKEETLAGSPHFFADGNNAQRLPASKEETPAAIGCTAWAQNYAQRLPASKEETRRRFAAPRIVETG